jgi:hypothetical protein
MLRFLALIQVLGKIGLTPRIVVWLRQFILIQTLVGLPYLRWGTPGWVAFGAVIGQPVRLMFSGVCSLFTNESDDPRTSGTGVPRLMTAAPAFFRIADVMRITALHRAARPACARLRVSRRRSRGAGNAGAPVTPGVAGSSPVHSARTSHRVPCRLMAARVQDLTAYSIAAVGRFCFHPGRPRLSHDVPGVAGEFGFRLLRQTTAMVSVWPRVPIDNRPPSLPPFHNRKQRHLIDVNRGQTSVLMGRGIS